MKSNKVFGVSLPLVFGILIAVLLGTSGFFLYKSYSQLNNVLGLIWEQEVLHTVKLLSNDDEFELKSSTEEKLFELQLRATLEHDTMILRQHLTRAALSTRTWMRFMSLMFGSILIVIGSTFILGKVSSDDASTAKVESRGWKGSLSTSSPGVLLVFFGVVLVAIPNISSQIIESNDTSSFFSKLHFLNSEFASDSTNNPSDHLIGQEILKNLRE